VDASAAELPKGRVFDSKPVRVMLEAGKMYGWCTCGHSNKQVSDTVTLIFSNVLLRGNCEQLLANLGNYNVQ